MLQRKIEQGIREYLNRDRKKILVIDGARQTGKTFIIRHVGKQMFRNFIEVNMLEDSLSEGLFAEAKTKEGFYMALSSVAGEKLSSKDDTLVFLDEIQAYPHLLTLLKFLRDDDRYTYIASGSLLGVTLSKTTSIPMGSIDVKHMYPLDFEEFCWAAGIGRDALEAMRHSFETGQPLSESMHRKMMDTFRKYLIVGGLPECVNIFQEDQNVARIRSAQTEIHEFYSDDAGKYDKERKLVIKRIYSLMPSMLANKKKRITYCDIEGKDKRYANYIDEFDYLTHAGIAIEVRAISQPKFPLIESTSKNLLKLYLNDVGLLTNILYHNNIAPIMKDDCSVNLGAVYECVVAQELKAHGNSMYYYDNKQIGEVDFLIDDYNSLSAVPLEVKSGKDYKVHSALNRFLNTPDYGTKKAYLLSNERNVTQENGITYIPVYYIMFFDKQITDYKTALL